MYKLVSVLLVAVFTAFSLNADTTAAQKPKRKRPPTAKWHGPASGGVLEKQYTGNVVRVINAQSVIPEDQIAPLTLTIRRTSQLPVECVKGEVKDCPLAAADLLVATPGVGAGVLLVEDPKLPIELVSSDRRWGILNLTPLKADSPAPELLFQRFRKVYWGVIARTLGAGTSSYPGCVLVPYRDLKGLDAIKADRPCPEPFNKMVDTAASSGIGVITISTYRKACEQGWAPQPTNDVQRKVWDEVHQLPTEPIKIKPEAKKVVE